MDERGEDELIQSDNEVKTLKRQSEQDQLSKRSMQVSQINKNIDGFRISRSHGAHERTESKKWLFFGSVRELRTH